MFNPSQVKTAFLSSTAKDLSDYRSAVRDAIEQMDGFKCIAMEQFSASSLTPTGDVDDRIRNCDIFIGLIGVCYGTRIPKSTFVYGVRIQRRPEVRETVLSFHDS